jgi:DNA-binding IclR family transcriptional regulator
MIKYIRCLQNDKNWSVDMGKTRVIQSIDKAINILELFKLSSRELSVKEISEELQISKSTVFGLINTLSVRGFLHQNPDNQKYSLGLALLELGELVQKNNIIYEKARPHLEKVVNKLNVTMHLAIIEKAEVVYIDTLEGNKSIFISSRIGTRNPIYCTGVGKCMLAFMKKDKRDNILKNMGEMEKHTENTIVNMDEFLQELDSIAKAGYSIDNEEFVTGIFCYAVPILNKYNEAIAAISILRSMPIVKDLERNEFIDIMKNVAREISIDLGY